MECIVKSHRAQAILDALLDFPVYGVTETTVMGCGRQKGYRGEEYRNKRIRVKLLSQVKLEFVVKDEVVEDLLRLITETVGAGERGNGKIFVYPCEDAMRISTKERGVSAILG